MDFLFRHIPTFNPIRVIEWVVVVCTAFSGLYVFSPFYSQAVQTDGPGALAAALLHPHLIYLYATFILIGAILAAAGIVLKQPRIRSAGWFIILLIRFFQVLLTWIAIAVQPITWIFPFTVMLVVLVLWMAARVEVVNNGRS